MKSKIISGLTVIVLCIAWLFIAPLVVTHAWALIAVNMFGAPVLTYWPAFWGMWALSIIFNRFGKFGGANKND